MTDIGIYYERPEVNKAEVLDNLHMSELNINELDEIIDDLEFP